MKHFTFRSWYIFFSIIGVSQWGSLSPHTRAMPQPSSWLTYPTVWAALHQLSPEETVYMRQWCTIALHRSQTSIQAHHRMLTYMQRVHDLMHMLVATRRNPSKLPASLQYADLPAITIQDYVEASSAYDIFLGDITRYAEQHPALDRALDLVRLGAQQALYRAFKNVAADMVVAAGPLAGHVQEAFGQLYAKYTQVTAPKTRGIDLQETWGQVLDSFLLDNLQELKTAFSIADGAYIQAHEAHKQAYLTLSFHMTDAWIRLEQERVTWYQSILSWLPA